MESIFNLNGIESPVISKQPIYWTSPILYSDVVFNASSISVPEGINIIIFYCFLIDKYRISCMWFVWVNWMSNVSCDGRGGE